MFKNIDFNHYHNRKLPSYSPGPDAAEVTIGYWLFIHANTDHRSLPSCGLFSEGTQAYSYIIIVFSSVIIQMSC